MVPPQKNSSPDQSAFGALLHCLLGALEALERIQMRLDPTRIPEFQAILEKPGTALADAAETLARAQEREELAGDAGQLLRSAAHLLKALSRFQEAGADGAGVRTAFLALRSVAGATEELYPLAPHYESVDRFFREPDTQKPPATQEQVQEPVGVLHEANRRNERGGFSLYVPEFYAPDLAWPLVIACHGGSGHGADFLWSWVREARSLGFLVLAPTSRARTWSLQAPFADLPVLKKRIEKLQAEYTINPKRILVTGISDGGTFALLQAMMQKKPVTHYAPLACAAHAFLGQPAALNQLKSLPIYLVHGARDWMFSIQQARRAAEALEAAGAQLVYREIADLSHNYPRDENRRILRWFLEDRAPMD